VPVVTVKSARNAACELVSEETGLAVKLDARELGSAICTLLTNDTLRGKMANAAKDAAKEYDWDGIVTAVSHLYELIRKS